MKTLTIFVDEKLGKLATFATNVAIGVFYGARELLVGMNM
jgi:hypothetical protein